MITDILTIAGLIATIIIGLTLIVFYFIRYDKQNDKA